MVGGSGRRWFIGEIWWRTLLNVSGGLREWSRKSRIGGNGNKSGANDGTFETKI